MSKFPICDMEVTFILKLLQGVDNYYLIENAIKDPWIMNKNEDEYNKNTIVKFFVCLLD